MSDELEQALRMKTLLELEEAVTRNMNDTFRIVNDANARVHALEDRIRALEMIVRSYDPRDSRTHSSHTASPGITRNDEGGAEGLGQGGGELGS
jgi:hypothetical protein